MNPMLFSSRLEAAARLSGLLLCLCAAADAQGPLTPPGAPAPTGKSLAQIEPRIDLATLPATATAAISISAPGAYYASGNIPGSRGRTPTRHRGQE